MIRQTRAASRQIDDLLDNFIEKQRDQAVVRLREAVESALAFIEANPTSGSDYPAPYPEIARWGYRWVKFHRYWFAYSLAKGYPVVTNVFYDTADIPGRVAEEDDEVPI